jgi:putative transposase
VVETTMELSSWLRKQVEEASPDLVRAMVQEMAEALMGAEADALCGAGYGERTPERLNGRNGYREREWHARGHDRARGAETAGGEYPTGSRRTLPR